MNILSFNTIASAITKQIKSECGLNGAQTRIILFFAQNNNSALTMGVLANKLGISLSTLSRQLKHQKTHDLIEITRSENDSSKKVHLNSAGLRKSQELVHAIHKLEKQLLSFSNQDELTNFYQEMAKIMQNASKLN